jgi:hypothetical protein
MMINEYGPVGGMRTDKRNLPQFHIFAHQNSQNIINSDQMRANEMGRYIELVGEMRYPYKIVVGKSDGKIPLGSHQHTFENNIKKYIAETMCVWTRLMRLTNSSGGLL